MLPAIQVEPPKKKTLYKNRLWFTTLSNVSKTIYTIGDEACKKSFMKVRSNGMAVVPFVKLFYLDYLDAGRISEHLLDPLPKCKPVSFAQREFMNVVKINEKHFEEYERVKMRPNGTWIYKGKGKREMVNQYIPIDDEYEKKMWLYITDSGTNYTLDFLEEIRKIHRTNITHGFNRMFKHDLTDGKKVYRNAGINPHILRHSRVFNLLINKRYPKEYIGPFLGWNIRQLDDMLDTYTYIREQLNGIMQLEYIAGFLRQVGALSLSVEDSFTSLSS
jgi:hypothetical protein